MSTESKVSRTGLLASAALSFLIATPALAQAAAQTATTDEQPPKTAEPEPGTGEFDEDGDEIVVTGRRRGEVIGDIPAENVLTARDVRATGATDINELLEALAPQIGSARGRGGERPITLLNGQRISSFRELRDIPTEAIQRVDILPEEVALKYGYRADQRVVNIVLRPRFMSTVTRAEGGVATEGGYANGLGDVTRLLIGEDSRTTVNLRAEAHSQIKESERDIDPGEIDERDARTLTGSRSTVRGNVTHNRTLFGDVSTTLNGELQHSQGDSLLGLPVLADGTPVLGADPRNRDTTSDTGHAGLAMNGQKDRWRWSVTGNADLARDVTKTDQDEVDSEVERDRARSTRASGDVDITANGPLFALPAGDASATVRVGASGQHIDSSDRRDGETVSSDIGRAQGEAALNVDLPISRRGRDFEALGNLTLNANAEIERLSDFGTLTTVGAGMNWSPVEQLNLIASWTREEGAPSMQQLGDPIVETEGSRIFDFTTGETVFVTAIGGGNADLDSDRRNVMKIGANWKPLKETDLRFRGEYVRSRIDNPISSFPGVTEALEEAFPERFVRDENGDLVSVDLRPVNFEEAHRDTVRWGLDFTMPLTSAPPSQAAIEQFRARRRAAQAQSGGGAPREGGPPPGGEGPPPEGARSGDGGRRGFGGFGGFGGGAGGRFGGGRQGGRLTFSLTHTLTLKDEVTIAPGVPELDYLDGDALGSTGGRSRHEVEAQAGYYNNGLGARLGANWRSGTNVDAADGNHLRFSPFSTFDLRFFANLGERFDLVAKRPWLRGVQLRFEVDNLFDSKPRVRDEGGGVPSNYQPDILDPIGRTASISIRKLFLPPPSFFRRQGTQGR